jgi:peptidoglycan/LPS O-acetylase OafA/YrhL
MVGMNLLFDAGSQMVETTMQTEVPPPVAAPFSGRPAASKPRLEFVDNLRWVMIVLVVSMHAAVTYSHIGSWYFMEDPKPGTLVMAVFATYQIFLQAFFMGLLFLLAGYFVPPAFDRKGPLPFIVDRAIRLGVPSLFYMIVIHPVVVYGLLQRFAAPTRPGLAQAWWPYLRSGRFLSGSGPMWFALALLGFSIAYAGFCATGKRSSPKPAAAPVPGSLQVIGLILIMGACSFLVRIAQPMGTNILNMQLCFFSQYILLFWIGIRARRENWLMRIPYRFGMRWLILALSFGSAAWIALLAALLWTGSVEKLGGGLTWQSAAYSFWEAFFCLGMCLGLVVLFREKLNHQGKAQRWLSDNSFAVYLFHTPLLIAVTLMMRGFDAPKLIKFLVATILGVLVTYFASALVFRRIPVLRRLL